MTKAMTNIPERCGQPIDVGGHRLYARVVGTGGPTVVFENGGGSNSLVWAWVQDAIAETTTTVAYDRAGIGWSEPRGGPVTPAAVSKDLDALLTAIRAPQPLILVAHSIGGLYAIDFCARHRESVAALVLVDASHPAVYEQILSTLSGRARLARRLQAPALAAADQLGLLSAMTRRRPEPTPPGVELPRGWKEARDAFWRGRNRIAGNVEEIRALPAMATKVAGVDLGDLPVTVISAGKPDNSFKSFWDIWQRAQSDLLQLSSNSRHITVETSGHNVQLTDPAVVIAAIQAHLVERNSQS